MNSKIMLVLGTMLAGIYANAGDYKCVVQDASFKTIGSFEGEVSRWGKSIEWKSSDGKIYAGLSVANPVSNEPEVLMATLQFGDDHLWSSSVTGQKLSLWSDSVHLPVVSLHCKPK